LGFERKARLFCDVCRTISHWDSSKLLGFERKSRLFCDPAELSDRYSPLGIMMDYDLASAHYLEKNLFG